MHCSSSFTAPVIAIARRGVIGLSSSSFFVSDGTVCLGRGTSRTCRLRRSEVLLGRYYISRKQEAILQQREEGTLFFGRAQSDLLSTHTHIITDKAY